MVPDTKKSQAIIISIKKKKSRDQGLCDKEIKASRSIWTKKEKELGPHERVIQSMKVPITKKSKGQVPMSYYL